MDNYEARSCTCLCGAQTCCRCLKELGSTHSAGRASVHSSNLESQIISSDTNGGRSSLVSVPSNSGLPMDVTNGSETLSLLLDLTQPLVMGLTWVHLYK
ncbi:hypothetical protein SO802_013428 [Lithocarpus litseifolius]|uniref:Metallothionein n=1 Tax=Lithocarpus litseifolius TaxID=425828 RepID=A0AAW2D7S6_9ROSI